MESYTGTYANASSSVTEFQADADTAADDEQTLRAAYVLVEDLDHLWRTGISRQILALRWSR